MTAWTAYLEALEYLPEYLRALVILVEAWALIAVGFGAMLLAARMVLAVIS